MSSCQQPENGQSPAENASSAGPPVPPSWGTHWPLTVGFLGLCLVSTAVSCATGGGLVSSPTPVALPKPSTEPVGVSLPPRPPVLPPSVGQPRETAIRVLLSEDVDAVRLSVRGACRVTDLRGVPVRDFPSGLPSGSALARPEGIVLGGFLFAASRTHGAAEGAASQTGLEIVPMTGDAGAAALSVEGRSYRGRLRLLRSGSGTRLTAVNVVDLEEYLTGVLRGELPAGWHPETYRAQAVASRSFVLAEKYRRGPDAAFDVRATVASQVYHGAGDSSPHSQQLRWAVAATAGQVLVIDGQILHAYFCSTCGGETEPASLCWPAEPMNGALAGGSRCDYCSLSPRYRWGPVVWEKSAVLEKLRRHDPDKFSGSFGSLVSVSVASIARSGRPAVLRLRGSGGLTQVLSAYQFRLAVSDGEPRERILPSSYFEVSDQGRSVSFANGRGFGHGVGLCQWGAEGQARVGRDYRAILSHYYPSSALRVLR